MFARVSARVAAAPSSFRTLSTSVVRKDLVQDLYIKELKAYKAPEASKSASLSAVKSFSPPTPPQAPASLSTSLAADLQTYESTAVDLTPKEAKVGKSGEEVVAEMTLDDLFEEMKADLPKHTSAH